MNKQELIKAIATGSGVSQSVAGKMLATIQQAIENSLIHGEKVRVRGFGTFSVIEHSARKYRHPKLSEMRIADAYRTVRFIPSGQIKENLN